MVSDRRWILLLVTILATGPLVAEKWQIELDTAALNPETARSLLNSFSGRIDKISAVNDKSKTTVAIGVKGDRKVSNAGFDLCEKDAMLVKSFSFPHAALVLSLTEQRPKTANGHAKEAALSCMVERIPGLRGVYASASRQKIRLKGTVVARLFLVKFKERDRLDLDMPRKIGR